MLRRTKVLLAVVGVLGGISFMIGRAEAAACSIGSMIDPFAIDILCGSNALSSSHVNTPSAVSSATANRLLTIMDLLNTCRANMVMSTTSAVASGVGISNSNNGGVQLTTTATETPPLTTPSVSTATSTVVQPIVVTVRIDQLGFFPSVLTVPRGSEVYWRSFDSAAHRIVSDEGVFASSLLNLSDRFSHTFREAGIFTYHDPDNPLSRGIIVVE